MKILSCAFIFCTFLQSYAQQKHDNLYYSQRAEKAHKMKNVGILLTVLGGISLIVGAASDASDLDPSFSYTPGQPPEDDNDETGKIAAIVGVAFVGTGVPLIIVGGKKKRMYEQKLKEVSVKMNTHPQKEGFTLIYRF